MFSRRILVTAVAAGATAAAIASAAPAYALTTVTVTAGSAPSGTSVAVTGTSGSLSLKDLTTNANGSCASSNLSGTTTAGANSPSNVAQINGGAGSIAFNSCTTLGLPFTIAGVGTNTWTIAATGNTASGATPINITGINVAVDSTSCSFTVSGSAAGSFVNGSSSSQITLPVTTASTSNLVVSNVVLKGTATKCLAGAVTNTTPGNKISLSGTYTLSATNSAYNPVTAIAS